MRLTTDRLTEPEAVAKALAILRETRPGLRVTIDRGPCGGWSAVAGPPADRRAMLLPADAFHTTGAAEVAAYILSALEAVR